MTGQNERVLDQFRQQAPAYAALIDAQGGSKRDPLMALIDPQHSFRVLDVGCGSGQFALQIAPSVAHVTGIDLTPEMLDQARQRAGETGVANVTWVKADSVALPVGDESFDLVISRSMFHHAADPAATLAEMRRACARGGRLFVSDLCPATSKGPAFDTIELLRDPSHHRALSSEELRALGAEMRMTEIAFETGATALPLDSVLATSFPPPGMADHVRSLLLRDAIGGSNIFGLSAEVRDGVLWVTYPTAVVGWSRD